MKRVYVCPKIDSTEILGQTTILLHSNDIIDVKGERISDPEIIV